MGRRVLLYEPLSWQIDPLNDMADILLLTGSAGGGKSRTAGEKIHAFCKKYPKSTGLMLRKTRESMTNSTVLFMDRLVIGEDSEVRHYPSMHRFEYSNGSVLVYGGMKDDDQKEQIRSVGLEGGVDIAWLEEANKFTEPDFNEVLARMRGKAAPWSQVILTTNPDAPTHWINRQLIIGGGASVYYSGAKDNPYNPESYIDYLNRLTGLSGKRLREGLWVQAEGVVYEDFDPAIHLINQFKIPKSWRRFRVVDFGYTNPLVCQWWAEDGDGRLYLYREYYKTQTLVEDAAKECVAAQTNKEFISENICDHDAEDRKTFERHAQCQTKGADKRVKIGIQLTQSRFKAAGDGKPRIFIMRNTLCHAPDQRLLDAGRPTCTAEELPAYVWHQDLNGKPNKEEPIPENDHGMDDMRYMVMRLDGRKQIEVRFI